MRPLRLAQPVTLRARLLIRYLVILAGLLLATASLQYAALRHFLVQAAEQRLRNGAHTAIQQFWRPSDATRLAHAAADPQTAAWILSPHGHLWASAVPPHPPLRAVPLPPLAGLPAQVWHGWILVRIPVRPPGRPHPPAPGAPQRREVLVLGEPYQAVQEILAREVQVLALGGAAALVVAGGVGGWALRRGLAPLDQIARTADLVAGGDLTLRATVGPETPEEVARVGRAFNGMLDRLATALAHEQAARERMQRFLMDASHELRTPVTAMAGFLEVLRAGAARQDAARLDRSLQTAYAQARRMASLVDQLLALARLEQPEPLRLQRHELGHWLDSLAPELETAAGDHPFCIEWAPRTEPTWCDIDDQALARALLNAIDNAAKYSPPGLPIRIVLGQMAGWAHLTVIDQGPGIAPEEQALVFERFVRGHIARHHQIPGTGLGLAIVRAVVTAHRGTVSLACPPSGGTHLKIALPLADPPRPTAEERGDLVIDKRWAGGRNEPPASPAPEA